MFTLCNVCYVFFMSVLDLSLPENCRIVTEPSQAPPLAMQHLLLSGASEDSTIHFFSLLHSCSVISCIDVKEVKNASLLTNSMDLLLFSSDPKWLCDGSAQLPQPAFSQKLSNLMNVVSIFVFRAILDASYNMGDNKKLYH